MNNEKDKWSPEILFDLEKRRSIALAAGGESRMEKQRALGKLTARERIELLFDEGTFSEIDMFVEPYSNNSAFQKKSVPGDGVVTGYGKINGRLAFASAQDFTVIGGTLGEYHSFKICHVMDMALDMKAPYISINDSGGARIEEGVNSLNGYSAIFFRNTMASGVVPQISVILGPCAGGACYSPAICDFIFMSENSANMFITGPQVVKIVTGENVTVDELGSASVHGTKSGVAHFVYSDDVKCLSNVRQLLSYLPQNNIEKPPFYKGIVVDDSDVLQSIVPENQKLGYDVRRVIKAFADKDSFLEVQENFARNIVIGFFRLDGNVVAVVANQPSYLAGTLNVDASDKASRFIRFCDCFNIPILTLVDATGFLPGKEQEHSGIIRHGAKLLYAYSEATVPKIGLIMRKAYGGAYIAMNSKNTGADIVFAWPIAQIAVMGADSAVDVVYRKQLDNAENRDEMRQQYIEEYNNTFMNPYIAAAKGCINEVIKPEETREKILKALEMLSTKTRRLPQKKHGNIPL